MSINLFNTIKFKLVVIIGVLIVISSITSTVIINAAVRYRAEAIVMPFAPTGQASFVLNQNQLEAQLEQERSERVNRVFIVSVLVVSAQATLACMAIYFVVRRMLAPLEDLNAVMQEINAKKIYQEISVENESEEIVQLISNFNAMMHRLNKAFVGQKQFVENVSHEIKTPLTIIKTNLESILLDKDLSQSELHAAIQTSIQSIDFLNRLSEDLLLLSFLDSQQLVVDEVSINSVAQEAAASLRPLLQGKSIVLETIFSNELTVVANSTLVQRAIANLLENAVKYSPSNSTIQLRTYSADSKVFVAVSDQGNGIPRKYKSKIFGRFFRIDPSRSRHTGGSGLGLAITREIVLHFNGQLRLSSNKKGSTFTIVLPAKTSL